MHPEWELLGETISSGATTTIVTGLYPGATSRALLIQVSIPSFSTGAEFGLRFNRDGESNYGYKVINNGANDLREITHTGNTQGELSLIENQDGVGITKAVSAEISIPNNTASLKKLVWWKAIEESTTTSTTFPTTFDGAGLWNNTASQINTVEIYTCGASSSGSELCPATSVATFGVGTRITVYGSRP